MEIEPFFVCKLKFRGCPPETLTADGKADRILRGLHNAGQRGCKFSIFQISGLYRQKVKKIRHSYRSWG